MKILFLDIEGVMTKGMMGGMLRHTFLSCADTVYSSTATSLIRKLVKDHDFQIVLITRHGKNESAVLNHRLAMAGISNEWLYKLDPDAIPSDRQSKGDAIIEWLKRNQGICVEQTVAVDDSVIELKGYDPARTVSPDPDYGFTQADYNKVLGLFALDAAFIPVPSAIARRTAQALQAR